MEFAASTANPEDMKGLSEEELEELSWEWGRKFTILRISRQSLHYTYMDGGSDALITFVSEGHCEPFKPRI